VKTLLSWLGGKSRLVPTILKRMPKHAQYVEPFFGGGALFWRKERCPREVVNDRDDRIVNLLAVAQRHPDALVEEITHLVYARRIFEEAKAGATHSMTDVERAARFWLVVRGAFISKATSNTSMKIQGTRIGLTRRNILGMVAEAHERLAGVVIENRDFESLLTLKWPRTTFAYVDPPYVGHEDYYEVTFSNEDHERLAQVLEAFPGKWLLSYNNHRRVRQLYKGRKIESVSLHYSSTAREGRMRKGTELLIANY